MKKFSVEIKWAIIFTIVSLLWVFGEKMTGLHDLHIDRQPLYATFFAIPALVIYVLALQEKKKKIFNGQITWTQAFISGTFLALFITILNPLVQYISYEIISPNYFKMISAYRIAHKVPVTTTDSLYNIKSYIMQGILNCMSLGVVTSAIVALFIKTKAEPSNEK
ncbi:DUF4199 domain-containing protein [Flavobacterium sp. 3HN19-14]|uniref:DUF4199 domain-containing protein n=1 Tax=Flavobacterium sp. 3HN19-14 TaxID=3448133 RepID=UPI003EE17C45